MHVKFTTFGLSGGFDRFKRKRKVGNSGEVWLILVKRRCSFNEKWWYDHSE